MHRSVNDPKRQSPYSLQNKAINPQQLCAYGSSIRMIPTIEKKETNKMGFLKKIIINIRIGRGEGLWEDYPVERILTIILPYNREKLEEKELMEIDKYGVMLANQEQAIIKCECSCGDIFIYTPEGWIK